MKNLHALLAGTAALAAVSLVPGVANAQANRGNNVQAGTLDCAVSGGVGLIITSKKTMDCVFRKVNGSRERYVGSIRKFGLDIGATSGGQMVWTVYAPSGRFKNGALSGNYVGASADASVGAGVGANVLVGGGDRSFSLQPVSVQGQTGLNLALGVADLRLDLARRAR